MVADCCFAVYDGHGGHEVAELVAERLPAALAQGTYLPMNVTPAMGDPDVRAYMVHKPYTHDDDNPHPIHTRACTMHMLTHAI